MVEGRNKPPQNKASRVCGRAAGFVFQGKWLSPVQGRSRKHATSSPLVIRELRHGHMSRLRTVLPQGRHALDS